MDEMLDRAAPGRELARTILSEEGPEPLTSLQAVVSRGTVLKSMGRLPEAAEVLRQGIARFPDADELAQEYAWISHEVGDFAFGTVHWRHLRAHAPTNLDGYLGGGLASRRAGAFEAADRIYELGIERFPDNPTLHIDYAWSAEERQDFAEAVRRWAIVRERFPDLPEGVVRPGLAHLAAGRLAEADAALAEAVERYPQDVEALTEYAFVAQLQGRWATALTRWERVIMRYPELPLPRRFCAAALLELGRYREAETVLAPALRMFPDDLELVVTQAWIATRGRSDLDAAGKLWDSVRSRDPERLDGYHGAAAALIEAGRLDDADALLNAAVERFPAEVAAAMEWARLPERREDWALAITRWETVVARFVENPDSYAGLGNALMLGSRLAEAQTVLKAAGAQFPDDVEVAAAAGRVAERGADWPQALIRWKAVQTRFPQAAIGYAGYGRSLREFGELIGAITQLREGLARFPEDLELNIELAVTLGAQRDWPQALAAWDSLKRRHPGNRVVAGYITNVLGLALADQALAGPAAFRIPPALLETSNIVTASTTDQAALLTRFESLGDSCEFAMVRRLYDCAAGQSSRARLADLLIASIAAANGLPLYTRNPSDFSALERIVKVVKV